MIRSIKRITEEQTVMPTDYQSIERLSRALVTFALDEVEMVKLDFTRDEALRLAGALHRFLQEFEKRQIKVGDKCQY